MFLRMKRFLLWLTTVLLAFGGCSSESVPAKSSGRKALSSDKPAETTDRPSRKFALPLDINLKVPEEIPPEIQRPSPPITEP